MRNNQWGVSMKICIDLGGGAGMSGTDAKMLLYFMIGIMILCGVIFNMRRNSVDTAICSFNHVHL